MAVLVEKPLCSPELAAAQNVLDKVNNSNTKVFIGYNHVVGKVATKIRELTEGRPIGLIETIDVEFRENWSGIFDAHPWLNGPADSYLGYWRRGGGAMGEHSHAINLCSRAERSSHLSLQYHLSATGLSAILSVSSILTIFVFLPILQFSSTYDDS